MPKKNAEVKEKTVQKDLMFELTEKERVKKQDEFRDVDNDIGSLKNEIAEFRRAKNAEIKELQVTKTKLNKILEENAEPRNVKCTVRYIFATNKVQYVYKGEVMEERELEDWERQDELFDEETPKPSKKALKLAEPHSEASH